jgi:hypothetical protein
MLKIWGKTPGSFEKYHHKRIKKNNYFSTGAIYEHVFADRTSPLPKDSLISKRLDCIIYYLANLIERNFT